MANIKAVAKQAGVSASTVSRVLSGKIFVEEDKKKRVMDAIKEMNYTPNALAKGLKMGHSRTIALIVPNIANLIFPQIAKGVENIARKNGYTVVLCSTNEDEDMERQYIDNLRNRWIDGFIIASMQKNSRKANELYEQKVPVVLVNRYHEDDQTDIVTVDNYDAAYNAVSYLIRGGRKRIAIALGSEEHVFYRDRFRGYQDALKTAGIAFDERLVMREDAFQEDRGRAAFYQLTKKAMMSDFKPDAIFATSDPKAIVIMHALHDLNIRIPEDVAVMGFDNVELSASIEPPLTTVSQPLNEIGEMAAEKLIRQIRYKEEKGILPEPSKDVLNTELIVRRST